MQLQVVNFLYTLNTVVAKQMFLTHPPAPNSNSAAGSYYLEAAIKREAALPHVWLKNKAVTFRPGTCHLLYKVLPDRGPQGFLLLVPHLPFYLSLTVQHKLLCIVVS